MSDITLKQIERFRSDLSAIRSSMKRQTLQDLGDLADDIFNAFGDEKMSSTALSAYQMFEESLATLEDLNRLLAAERHLVTQSEVCAWCGVTRSEHQLAGCPDGFQTAEERRAEALEMAVIVRSEWD